MLMATKRCRVVTYHHGLPFIMSHNPSITWSCEVQILHISTCTIPTASKHEKVVTYHEGLPPINLHNPLNMQSTNKLKRLCFHYHDASCHQTCQGGAIPRGASTHEFKISVNQVVF